MKLKFIVLFFLAALSLSLKAQNYTISGFVSDARTGEYLLGANVYEPELMKGVASNAYGFYSLTLPKGKHKIVYSFVGYQPVEVEIDLHKNMVFDAALSETIELSEVEIRGDMAQSRVQSSQMSVTKLPIKTIQNLPVLLGEVDIIKTIQLLPGVQSGREGSSGLYVRGGGPDQNLVLLDGVPVYNVNHLFGFFSVFNADAINSVSLTKGGFPARYGGRLSSVLDIRMREGNMKEFKGSGSIGLISSKLTLEGPIVKDQTSFIISGRRTYLDVLAQPFIGIMGRIEGLDKLRVGYYFYDLNGKINHKFSDKSRLYLSAYTGKDEFYARVKESYSYDDYHYDGTYTTRESETDVDMGLGWGNITTSLRWNYILNQKLFSNTTFIYSRYKFYNEMAMEETESNEKYAASIGYSSGIDDLGLKVDFDYAPLPEHNVKFGISSVYHKYNPGITAFKLDEANAVLSDTTFGNNGINAIENDVYVEDDFEFGGIFKANVGLHYSSFFVRDVNYHSIQPRLSLRAMVSDKWSWKAAYTKMTQYLHLLTNSNIGLPNDLWVPATDNLKPMYSDQFALGMVYNFNNDYSLSIEGYYKTMHNLVEYRDGASFLSFKDDWEQKVVQGDGWSYGLEVLFQKELGNTTGWIGYTLSWTDRKFEEINFGEVFPYKYDRRHDISVVVTHKFSDNFDIGASWVYGTGYSSTMALEQYIMPDLSNPLLTNLTNMYGYYGGNIEHIEHRNNFRMPAYHRMDIGLNFRKDKDWGRRTWSFGLYNAYGRQNPYFLMFMDEWVNDKEVRNLKQISLLPVPIPFISYKFEFGMTGVLNKNK